MRAVVFLLLSFVCAFKLKVGRFRSSVTGGTAVVFALCLLPTIGVVGLGIDYMQALSYKRRLDAAADSSALAAISAAQTYYNANNGSMTDSAVTSGAIAAGNAQGLRAFKVNSSGAYSLLTATPAVTVTRSLQTFTSSVNYTAQMATSFGKLFGTPKFNLGLTTGSTLTMGSYIDFYLMLDVSGSMGLPTSNDGQTALAAINPDQKDQYPSGCVFACHYSGYKGYGLAKSNNIKLRVDSVASAVTNLISTANSTKTLTNQFRIGVYPFIVDAMQAAPLSTDFTQATQVANNLAANYLDTGTNSTMGAGGTHFENVFPDVVQYFKGSGAGTSAQAPKAFVFLVTDGMDNAQTYTNSNFSGSSPGEPNNFGYCQYAQGQGVTIAILYIPYVPIQNPNHSFANDEDGKVNNIISNVSQPIPIDLKNCATPGYFFTANSDADINNAMQTMFAQALQAARLIK